MAGTFTAQAIGLRAMLTRILGLIRAQHQPVMVPFDFDGDSTETDFTLPVGWKPVLVFSDGDQMRQGASWDYTQTFNGYKWTVSYDTAPTNTATVLAVRGVE